MIEVMFVGDEPSSKNHMPEVAFVGTKSYEVLKSWIIRFWPIGVTLENSHNAKSLKAIRYYYNLGYRVVALGNKASERLTKMNIEHFKLPHPSGRNRKLNDKKFIDLELEKCKNYLRRNG